VRTSEGGIADGRRGGYERPLGVVTWSWRSLLDFALSFDFSFSFGAGVDFVVFIRAFVEFGMGSACDS